MTSETDPARRASMHIGEVAARTELSLRSLRHWDEVGLVRPSGRSDGGFRLYTEDDVERIMLIRRMKPLGFSLAQMCEVMGDIDALRSGAATAQRRTEARSRLDQVLVEAGDRRGELARQLAMADEFIDRLTREIT